MQYTEYGISRPVDGCQVTLTGYPSKRAAEQAFIDHCIKSGLYTPPPERNRPKPSRWWHHLYYWLIYPRHELDGLWESLQRQSGEDG